MERREKLEKLKGWMEESRHTVILTGAGMSTESGLADFRSKEGLWKKIDPMKLASIDSLRDNYDHFHEFYKMRMESLGHVKPHEGYDILADWERRGLVQSIITQNVDDFHLLAGNKRVYRIHGSLNQYRCGDCGHAAEKTDFMDKKACNKCGGNLRPGVVLFGESLPGEELERAIEEMERADLVLVIGTSLRVYPVSNLPNLTRGKKVYINKELERDKNFDLQFQGKAGDILRELDLIL